MSNSANQIPSVHEQRFIAERDMRYHQMRCAYYETLDKVFVWASFIAGSATFATFAGWLPDGLYVAIGVIVTGASLMRLVFSPRDRADQHSAMSKRYVEWKKSMNQVDPTDAEALRRIEDAHDELKMDEPDFHKVVDTLAHNQACHALGYKSCECFEVGFPRRVVAHFFKFQQFRPKRCSESHPFSPPATA